MAVGAESYLGDSAMLPPTARRPFATFPGDSTPEVGKDPFEENGPTLPGPRLSAERSATQLPQLPQIPPCVRFNSSVEERRFEQSPESSIISRQQSGRLEEGRESSTPEGERFFNIGTEETSWERPTATMKAAANEMISGHVVGPGTTSKMMAPHGTSSSSSSSSVPIRLGEEVSVYSNSSRTWCHGYVENMETSNREVVVKVAFQLPGAERDQWHKKDLPIGHPDLFFLDPATEAAAQTAAAEMRGTEELPMPVSPKALNIMFQDTSLPKLFSDEELYHYDREFEMLLKAAEAEQNHSPSSSSTSVATTAATATAAAAATTAATTRTAPTTATATATTTKAAASVSRTVDSDVCAEYLKRCGLPRRVLKELWQVSNPDLKAAIGLEEFRTCCRLVGHCQSLLRAMLQDDPTVGQPEDPALTPNEIRELFKRGGGPLREMLRRGDRIGARPTLLPRFDVVLAPSPSPSPSSADSRNVSKSTSGL